MDIQIQDGHFVPVIGSPAIQHAAINRSIIIKLIWRVLLICATVIPKLGLFNPEPFLECGATPLYNIGIASIIFHCADLGIMFCVGLLAKNSSQPITTYKGLSGCWNCIYILTYLAGVIYATYAVNMDGAIECAEADGDFHRWWLTVFITDVIVGWIPIVFYAGLCCGMCCLCMYLCVSGPEEMERFFERHGEMFGRLPGVSEEQANSVFSTLRDR